MTWILLSLLAALFFAARFILIKKFLSDTDIFLTAFFQRFFGLLFLLPLLPFFPIRGCHAPLFWETIAITGVLTGVASVLQIKALSRHELSTSVPFLAFTPLFMVIAVYFIFHEVPSLKAFSGVIFLCGGAYLLGQGRAKGPITTRKFTFGKGSVLFFFVALIYGVSTTLDRVAIEIAGGFAYTFFWNLFSAFLFGLVFLNIPKWKEYSREIKRHFFPFLAQGFLAAGGFLCQMTAVQSARNVSANVVYVKALTMLQLLIAVTAGITVFGEKDGRRKLLAAGLMLLGALAIIFFYK
jgi:drug/metabolite transporter (DMT)-like permease